jgi:DNA-binding NarL/FixJ family response regulator
MPKVNNLAVIRVALVGGSDSLRVAKRAILEAEASVQIVYDSDGFGLLPQDFREVNFDVAIIEQRLGSQSAFDFVKILHTLAAMDQSALGRLLIASQFHETELRVKAIEAGAVDCVFVSDGAASLITKIVNCSDPAADFAIRELVPILDEQTVNQEGFQLAALSLDTLDVSATKVLKAFCQLKTDSEIAMAAGVPKVKVKTTLLAIQKLLLLNTRSQLLLKMYRLGALAL